MRFAYPILAVASSCLTACGIADGWNNFANNVTASDHHGFQSQAHQVAAGDFENLKVLAVSNAGSLVVARHRDGNSVTIALRSLDLSGGCDVVGTDDMVIETSDGTSSEVIVLDDPDGDGRGTLSFVDGHCLPLMDPLADAMLPDAIYYPNSFLVRADSRLLIMEPHQKSTKVLATKLDAIEQRTVANFPEAVLFAPSWFVDGGTFRALDAGTVAYSYGSAVSEVVPFASLASFVPTAYFLVDNGQLVMVSSTAATPIASDVCGVHVVDNVHIAYRQPCLSGTLKVCETSSGYFKWVALDPIGDKVLAFDGEFTKPTALFTRPSSDGSPGREIWLRVEAGIGQHVATHVAWVGSPSQYFPPAFYRDSSGYLHGEFTAIADSDGSAGRLIYWNQSLQPVGMDAGSVTWSLDLQTVGERVPVTEPFSPYEMQLANYDGIVGDFIDPFESTGQVVATGVPANPKAYAYDGAYQLLLAQFANGTGTLGILPSNRNISSSYTGIGARSVTWLASQVGLGTFRYFREMAAVSYIDRWNATRGSGRLVSHDFDYESDVYLADYVREKLELTRPWIGVVYAIAEGDSQGIWARHAN